MLGDPLVRAFEDGTIEPGAFRHREHLYVAWCYLKVLPLEDALPRYVHHLRRLTQRLGVPEKFHATLTWAYLVLLNDALQSSDLEHADFAAVLAQHPSLLDLQRGMVFDYYDRSEIDSEAAGQCFVLPRRRS